MPRYRIDVDVIDMGYVEVEAETRIDAKLKAEAVHPEAVQGLCGRYIKAYSTEVHPTVDGGVSTQ